MHALLHSEPPALQQAPPNPLLHQSLLGTHSQASLGQSLVGSLLLSPGSWWVQGFVCALQESVSPIQWTFCQLYMGLMVTSFMRAYAIPRSAAPLSLPLQLATADLYFRRRHLNTVLAQSLWGLWVLVCTRFVWALWLSIVGKVFDSKSNFAPPTVFLGLLLCPWMWGIFFWWDPTFFSQWSFCSKL